MAPPDSIPDGESALQIVVADDDPVTRRRIEGVLTKQGYRVHAVGDGAAAWEAIRRLSAPILITDWRMPELSGTELIRRIRAESLPFYVYVILLTSNESAEEKVEGLSAGADDYMTKPVDYRELTARIRAGDRVVRLETDLRAARGRLEVMASTDELTGVANRRAILARLRETLARVARAGGQLAVGIADIDHFKRLNDSFGHAAGDAVLRAVVGRLLARKRLYDIVGRLGGEEFLIVFPDTTIEEAHHVAERLREAIAADPFDVGDGLVTRVTISVGVSGSDAARDGTVESLLSSADSALYCAKETGRNRVLAACATSRRRDSASRLA